MCVCGYHHIDESLDMAAVEANSWLAQLLLGTQGATDFVKKRKILAGGSFVAFGIVVIGWYKKQQENARVRALAKVMSIVHILPRSS